MPDGGGQPRRRCDCGRPGRRMRHAGASRHFSQAGRSYAFPGAPPSARIVTPKAPGTILRFTAGPTRTIGLDATAIATAQQCTRRQLVRFLVRRGLLQSDDTRAMRKWEHGGGSFVDASVRIEAADRVGRERLLRYCARPPFALERLRQRHDEHLGYDHPKSGHDSSGPQILTPFELLDRLAALVPPSRVHRHRNFGVPARTAAHRKFPRRPGRAADGRTETVAIPRRR